MTPSPSARRAALLLLAALLASTTADNVALLYFWGGPLDPIRHESGGTVLVVGTQDIPFRICFTEPINEGCAPGYTQTGFSGISRGDCDVVTPYCECLYWVFAGKDQPSTIVLANDDAVLDSSGCVDFVLMKPLQDPVPINHTVEVEFYWKVAHADTPHLPPGLLGLVQQRANELAPVLGIHPYQWIEWITPEICDLITKDMPSQIRLLLTPAQEADQCKRTHTIRFDRIYVETDVPANYLAKMPYHAISIGGIVSGAFVCMCAIIYQFHFTR